MYPISATDFVSTWVETPETWHTWAKGTKEKNYFTFCLVFVLTTLHLVFVYSSDYWVHSERGWAGGKEQMKY